MCSLKETLEDEGHSILEMPTGTGKTVSLLSLILSYIMKVKPNYKLVYCTRTVVEMEKVLEELKNVIEARKKDNPDEPDILALCLSTRRNLCIHPEVSKEVEREQVDRLCRKKTASWVRIKAEEKEVGDIEELGLCSFYEGHASAQDSKTLDTGIFTLEDLKKIGKEKGQCPYYIAREYLMRANVAVFNYAYLLDPKVSGVTGEL